MIYNEDCIETMRRIPTASIDLMLTDPPYNTTACEWEYAIDLAALWIEWERIMKPTGTWIFTSVLPFTAELYLSRKQYFKSEIIWLKPDTSDFVNAKNRPMKAHENILVFSRGNIANGCNDKMTYNPQNLSMKKLQRKVSKKPEIIGERKNQDYKPYMQEFTDFPLSYIYFARPNTGEHPTQKPVDLFRYLVKTFSNENETVFDGYMGIGTTALACIEESRQWIGSEINETYYKTAIQKIKDKLSQPKLL